MKKKAKRWVIGALAFLVIGFVGLNLMAYNHARSMMHFTTGGHRTSKPEELSTWKKMKVLITGVTIPRPDSGRKPEDLSPDSQVLSINGPDGITLESWYCDRGDDTPLVLLFHGYAAEKTSLLDEARALLKLGASVMLVDFRGSGGSSESYTTVGVHEADDVAAVFNFALEKLSHSSIILFGQSMGAAAILRAVSQKGVRPDAVIIEAVFDTMLNTVRNRFHAMGVPSFPGATFLVFWAGHQWRFDGFRHNPIEYASSVQCPVLFMHGAEDPRATLAEGRRVFDFVPGKKEFVTFDHCGHESYILTNGNQWKAAVEIFVRKAENKHQEEIEDVSGNLEY